jgi:protein YibB
MKEIVIVTAFFAIKRDNWTGFNRSNELYFNYFKGWASMKNRMVAYVESKELKDKIIKYRKSVGLEERTIVNVIPNILDVDKELLASIESAVNPVQQRFRVLPKNPESWNSTYNYIMLMKQWCAADAVKRGQVHPEEMLAWVDFGFNHGGSAYSLESNFNFQWKYEFQDKINLFSTQPLDKRPIFDIILSMDTYIMGMVLVGTAKYWEQFRLLVRESMIDLNKCGLMDDDQNIILMSIRKQPDLFNVRVSSWNAVLYMCGCNHLISNIHKKNVILEKVHFILSRLKYRVLVLQYALRIFAYYKNRNIH